MNKDQDYLFRVSLKAVIRNENGELLVVKERGRDVWELPGGGMDHGETFEEAMKRELFEEISYQGNLTMKIVGVNEAKRLDSRAQETLADACDIRGADRTYGFQTRYRC